MATALHIIKIWLLFIMLTCPMWRCFFFCLWYPLQIKQSKFVATFCWRFTLKVQESGHSSILWPVFKGGRHVYMVTAQFFDQFSKVVGITALYGHSSILWPVFKGGRHVYMVTAQFFDQFSKVVGMFIWSPFNNTLTNTALIVKSNRAIAKLLFIIHTMKIVWKLSFSPIMGKRPCSHIIIQNRCYLCPLMIVKLMMYCFSLSFPHSKRFSIIHTLKISSKMGRTWKYIDLCWFITS